MLSLLYKPFLQFDVFKNDDYFANKINMNNIFGNWTLNGVKDCNLFNSLAFPVTLYSFWIVLKVSLKLHGL